MGDLCVRMSVSLRVYRVILPAAVLVSGSPYRFSTHPCLANVAGVIDHAQLLAAIRGKLNQLADPLRGNQGRGS